MLISLIMLFGCSNEDVNKDENENNPDPVTITMQHRLLSEGQFLALQEKVSEKYPYITVEGMDVGHEREDYEDAVAAQEIPDILAIVTTVHEENLFNVDLDYDLTELIEKFDYDLRRFDESTMEVIQMVSREGIMGLPSTRSPGQVLMYNKDIFDTLGIEHPKDGMTWDETLDLAKQLTVEREGIQYYGLLSNSWGHFIDAVTNNAPLLDPETYEPLLDTKEWRRGLELLKEIFSIPGYLDADADKDFVANSLIHKFPQREAAMAFSFIPAVALEWEEAGLSWDLTPRPYFTDGSLYPAGGTWTYTISSASEHKEDAFRVLTELLSDEMMILEGNKQGEYSRLSVTDKEVLDQVELNPALEDKNLDALYHHSLGPAVELSNYESTAMGEYIRDRIAKFIAEDEDLNTFIREASEEIEIMVAEEQAQK